VVVVVVEAAVVVVVVAEAEVLVVDVAEETWLICRISTARTTRERARRERIAMVFLVDRELMPMDRMGVHL